VTAAAATATKARAATPSRRTVGVVSDPIADMLTRIRNASSARHADVRVPSSRLKVELAQVLKDEGYIASFEVEPAPPGVTGETLRIIFKSRPDRKRAISGMKRISRPGLRVYARKTEIPRVLGGLGLVVLSTSQGVMSGRQALKNGLGGEVLCYVW
jgi:small subunit ribosomal protein S8